MHLASGHRLDGAERFAEASRDEGLAPVGEDADIVVLGSQGTQLRGAQVGGPAGLEPLESRVGGRLFRMPLPGKGADAPDGEGDDEDAEDEAEEIVGRHRFTEHGLENEDGKKGGDSDAEDPGERRERGGAAAQEARLHEDVDNFSADPARADCYRPIDHADQGAELGAGAEGAEERQERSCRGEHANTADRVGAKALLDPAVKLHDLLHRQSPSVFRGSTRLFREATGRSLDPFELSRLACFGTQGTAFFCSKGRVQLMTRLSWSALAATAALLTACASNGDGARLSDLTVEITPEIQKGEVRLSLFMGEEAYDGGAPVAQAARSAEDGAVKVAFTGLAPGAYAIKAFHDLNGNGILDTNVMGIPSEPFAFSNNAVGSFGPATFEQARFVVSPGANTHRMAIK